MTAGAPRKVVVATRNRGKLKEILRLLETGGLRFELVNIDEIAPDVVLVENENTFEGNALAKARQAAAATGLPALADDSGLEVDALGGAPGVWSARYAGEPSDDERNNTKLIAAMADVPDGQRAARFRCVAAFVEPGGGGGGSGKGIGDGGSGRGIEIARAGVCEGEILRAPRGGEGFGYDPLFFLPAIGRTMAELGLDEKNALSHRAAAFRALATDIAAALP